MSKIQPTYQHLTVDICSSLFAGKTNAVQNVNTVLVQVYWHVGMRLLEYKPSEREKTICGSKILKNLKSQFGKGYSKSNLCLMYQFHVKFAIFLSLHRKLSWSDYSKYEITKFLNPKLN